MADLPRISVITPSFNQAHSLEATMSSWNTSLLTAAHPMAVLNIERYADRLAYWVSKKDEGQTDALIKGFSRATGDIYCWLNSDDLFERATLFEVAEFFRSHSADRFVYGDATWIDADGRAFKPKREQPWSRCVWLDDHNFIPQPSAFWRADMYHEVGGLDPRFDLAMDADLWIRFADVTDPRHVRRLWSRMRFYPEQRNTRLRAKSGAEGRARSWLAAIPVSLAVDHNRPAIRCSWAEASNSPKLIGIAQRQRKLESPIAARKRRRSNRLRILAVRSFHA